MMKSTIVILLTLFFLSADSGEVPCTLKVSSKKTEHGHKIKLVLKNQAWYSLIMNENDVFPKKILHQYCHNGYLDYMSGGSNHEKESIHIGYKSKSITKLLSGETNKLKFNYIYTDNESRSYLEVDTCDFIYRVFDPKLDKGIKYTIKITRDTVYLSNESEIEYFEQWEKGWIDPDSTYDYNKGKDHKK